MRNGGEEWQLMEWVGEKGSEAVQRSALQLRCECWR